jgi:hypothetical protein
MMAFPWQSSMDRTKSCPSFDDKVNAGLDVDVYLTSEFESTNYFVVKGASNSHARASRKLMASASR